MTAQGAHDDDNHIKIKEEEKEEEAAAEDTHKREKRKKKKLSCGQTEYALAFLIAAIHTSTGYKKINDDFIRGYGK